MQVTSPRAPRTVAIESRDGERWHLTVDAGTDLHGSVRVFDVALAHDDPALPLILAILAPSARSAAAD
ncbi:MAG: hypothetical protein ACR2J8_04490 [Thermomicrobiales bacterium]